MKPAVLLTALLLLASCAASKTHDCYWNWYSPCYPSTNTSHPNGD
jgi:hypothetical protein